MIWNRDKVLAIARLEQGQETGLYGVGTLSGLLCGSGPQPACHCMG